jgi:hypothetical protein
MYQTNSTATPCWIPGGRCAGCARFAGARKTPPRLQDAEAEGSWLPGRLFRAQRNVWREPLLCHLELYGCPVFKLHNDLSCASAPH